MPKLFTAVRDRLVNLLDRACRQKRLGHGIAARPEFDPFLIRLMGMLEELEPGRGWIESAMATYAVTLDDALRQPRSIVWHRHWTEPIEESGAFQRANMQALLLRDEPTMRMSMAAVVQALWPTSAGEPPRLTPNLDAKGRRQLHDDVAARLAVLQTLMPRPDGSWPRVPPDVPLAPVEVRSLAPMWRNESLVPWPSKRAGDQRKLTRALELVGRAFFTNLASDLETGRRTLRGESVREGVPFDESDVAQIAFSAAWRPHGLAAYLDFLLGCPAAEVLQQLLAVSRLDRQFIRWRVYDDRSWVDHELLYEAMITGDFATCEVWLEHLRLSDVKFAGARIVRAMIAAWIGGTRPPSLDDMPGKLTEYEKAIVTGHAGLALKQANLIGEAIRMLLARATRVQYGRYMFIRTLVCPEAVAFARTARRMGLDPPMPDHPLLPAELLEADDPDVADAGWLSIPGATTLCSTEPLAWPTLFTNERVTGFSWRP